MAQGHCPKEQHTGALPWTLAPADIGPGGTCTGPSDICTVEPCCDPSQGKAPNTPSTPPLQSAAPSQAGLRGTDTHGMIGSGTHTSGTLSDCRRQGGTNGGFCSAEETAGEGRGRGGTPGRCPGTSGPFPDSSRGHPGHPGARDVLAL